MSYYTVKKRLREVINVDLCRSCNSRFDAGQEATKGKAAVCDGDARYSDPTSSALKSPHDAGFKL